MASSRFLLRSANPRIIANIVSPQFLSNRSVTTQSHHNDHSRNHQYLPPNDYVNSWKTPKNPREARKLLFHLHRDYRKKVKAIRKEYIQEMEVLRLEKQRKDEIRKQALRIESAERKVAKADARKLKAAENKEAQEELRQTILKEKAEKLEYYRIRQNKIKEKKEAEVELLRRQSSTWIDESELEAKILEAIVDN